MLSVASLAAAYAGADETIQFLADRGAKRDVMDRFGQTPLSIASAIITAGMADYADPRPRRYRKSTVDLLLQLGATSLEESGVQSLGSMAVSKEWRRPQSKPMVNGERSPWVFPVISKKERYHSKARRSLPG